MPVVALKKGKSDDVTIIKKMRDYSNEPTFKKKAENAILFLKKHELPKEFKKKK
jgi:hypothetical protein